jgi:hypothetical protein
MLKAKIANKLKNLKELMHNLQRRANPPSQKKTGLSFRSLRLEDPTRRKTMKKLLRKIKKKTMFLKSVPALDN